MASSAVPFSSTASQSPGLGLTDSAVQTTAEDTASPASSNDFLSSPCARPVDSGQSSPGLSANGQLQTKKPANGQVQQLYLPPLTPPSRPFSDILSIASSEQDDHSGRTWAGHIAHNTQGESDAWLPLILTCDGGGIRGYSSLLIIMELMKEVAKWEMHYEELEHREGATGSAQRQARTFDARSLLPCHYFDFMYGTSTGGLIATLLGRLRMDVPACLDIYKDVGNELFGKKRSWVPGATKYDHQPLERRVRSIVAQHYPGRSGRSAQGDEWHPWYLNSEELERRQRTQRLRDDCTASYERSGGVVDSEFDRPADYDETHGYKRIEYQEPYHRDTPERLCHSVLLTAVHNHREEAYLLRSYDHQYEDKPEFITEYNAGADPLRIWQATRATSAAPFFFKSLVVDIDGEKKAFMDGGIRENNPAGAAWSEFMSLYSRTNQRTILRAEPALLLSIGTGRPDMNDDGFAETWPGPLGHLGIVRKSAQIFSIVKHMKIKYTSGERQHDSLVQLAQGMHGWYKRLNVDTGLQNMRLDNWVAGEEIDPLTGQVVMEDAATHTHIHSASPQPEPKIIPGGETLSKLLRATTAYIQRDRRKEDLKEYAPPKVMLSQAAQKLVLHRRAREKLALAAGEDDLDRLRWDSFMGRNL